MAVVDVELYKLNRHIRDLEIILTNIEERKDMGSASKLKGIIGELKRSRDYIERERVLRRELKEATTKAKRARDLFGSQEMPPGYGSRMPVGIPGQVGAAPIAADRARRAKGRIKPKKHKPIKGRKGRR
jgi:hypothetical protein